MIKFSSVQFTTTHHLPAGQHKPSYIFFFKSEAKPAGTLAYIEICLHTKATLYLENMRNLFVDKGSN